MTPGVRLTPPFGAGFTFMKKCTSTNTIRRAKPEKEFGTGSPFTIQNDLTSLGTAQPLGRLSQKEKKQTSREEDQRLNGDLQNVVGMNPIPSTYCTKRRPILLP